MEIKNKRILVTGGNGFLGKHLVEMLKAEGVSEENIFVPERKVYDLTKPQAIEDIFTKFHPEIVVHLATNSGGVQYYTSKPATILYDNLLMGSLLLEASKSNKVQKFVFIGTGLIYPKDAPSPLKESSIWEGPPEVLSYGLASRVHLAQSQLYREEYGLNSIYLILPNLYGPKDHFDKERAHVIPSLIMRFDNAIKKKIKKIEFWGSGNAQREFLYVKDAAKSIVLAIKSYDSKEPLNIGPGNLTKIKTLVHTIGKIMGYAGEILPDETKPEGRLLRSFDSSQSISKLGFKPSFTLEEGLKETINWFKKNES